MNLLKVFQAGVKSGALALIGIILTVLAGAISYAMGYKPDGQIEVLVMTYIIAPVFAGAAGAINNYLKHKV